MRTSRKHRRVALLGTVFLLYGMAGILVARAKEFSPPVSQEEATPIDVIATAVDHHVATRIRPLLEASRDRIERFFGRRFENRIMVEVVPDRASFNAYFRKRWNIPKTEPWMVALGVADRMVVLSPRVWKTEADEHDPADEQHLRDLLTHELVHVYHGQRCPRPDFAGMDDLGWFVEGLAVYVSGQLEGAHRDDAAEAFAAKQAPTHLEKAWTGRYRYGVAGSMVEFIDRSQGRERILKLLSVVGNEEALKSLNMTEQQFLEDWRASVWPAP